MTTLPIAFDLTDSVLDYMTEQVFARAHNLPCVTIPPLEWPLDFRVDVEWAIKVLHKALGNEVRTTWSVLRYEEKVTPRNKGANIFNEDDLLKQFPPIKTKGLQIHPMVITDIDGHILGWYLPDIITPGRQKAMFDDLDKLEMAITKSGAGWRVNGEIYHEGSTPKLGLTSFSPAWFAQAHDRNEDKLSVSAPMVRYGSEIQKWLEICEYTHALVGAIFGVLQPALYNTVKTSYRRLSREPDLVDNREFLRKALESWNLPFNAVSLISNRLTPLHRDIFGRRQWFNLLLALGSYDKGRFDISSLGLRMKYNPGCIIVFSGKLLRHGSDCPAPRACLAYYMRDNVLKRLSTTVPGYDNISRWRPMVDEDLVRDRDEFAVI